MIFQGDCKRPEWGELGGSGEGAVWTRPAWEKRMAEDSRPWSSYRAEGYRSDMHVSTEYKVNRLTRMLAGYDDATWDRLRSDRKRTYERAGHALFYGFPDFVEAMRDMNAMPTFHGKGAR